MQNNFHLFIVRHISDKVNKNKSVYTQYERKSFYEKNFHFSYADSQAFTGISEFFSKKSV